MKLYKKIFYVTSLPKKKKTGYARDDVHQECRTFRIDKTKRVAPAIGGWATPHTHGYGPFPFIGHKDFPASPDNHSPSRVSASTRPSRSRRFKYNYVRSLKRRRFPFFQNVSRLSVIADVENIVVIDLRFLPSGIADSRGRTVSRNSPLPVHVLYFVVFP